MAALLNSWFSTSGMDSLAEPMQRAAMVIATKATVQTAMNKTFLPIYFV
jgi:hypothetical protein